MHTSAKKAPRSKQAKRGMSRYSKAVIRWLIFCFPAGLLMMWSDRCHWSRTAKSGVSCLFACALLAVLLPFTLPPARDPGGVQLVSMQPALEIQGPQQDEEDEGHYEVYVPTAIKPTSLFVTPTPTPEPIYVYCNAGGKKYHQGNCDYVKKTSARVTLGTALDAGFVRCMDCNAPKEYQK